MKQKESHHLRFFYFKNKDSTKKIVKKTKFSPKIKKGVISWRAKVSGNLSYKRLPFITERSRAAILRTSSAQNTLIVNRFLNLIFKLLLFRSAWNHFKTECWILCIWAKSRQKHIIDFHLAFWQTPFFASLFSAQNKIVMCRLWSAFENGQQHLHFYILQWRYIIHKLY